MTLGTWGCAYFLLGLAPAALGSVCEAATAPSAATLALVQGASLFEEGLDLADGDRPDEARDLLEQAAAKLRDAAAGAPDDGHALLLLGLTLRQSDDEESASAAFESSRRAARAPSERLLADARAARSRAAARQVAAAALDVVLDRSFAAALGFEPRPFWSGQAAVSVGADSNPNLLADGLELSVPDGNGLTSAESDAAISLDARFRLSPFYDRGGWTLGLEVAGERTQYLDFDFLHRDHFQGAVLLARGSNPLGYLSGPLGTTRVPVGASRVALLLQAGAGYLRIDEASYLRRQAAAASLELRSARTAAVQIDVMLEDRRYFASGFGDPRRSGGLLALRLGQDLSFRRGDRTLRLGVLAAGSRAERPFESHWVEPSLELAWRLRPRWHLLAQAAYRDERYDHRESDLFHFDPLTPPEVRRHDQTWRFNAVLSHPLERRLHVDLQATFTRRDSNLDGPANLRLDYDRLTTAIGLRWSLGGGP